MAACCKRQQQFRLPLVLLAFSLPLWTWWQRRARETLREDHAWSARRGECHLSDICADVPLSPPSPALPVADNFRAPFLVATEGGGSPWQCLGQLPQACTELNLRGYGLGDAGAAALADGLRGGGCRVTVLKLGHNGIGDVGAAALAGALAVNVDVRTVHLWVNRIGLEGTCFP